MAEVLRLGGAMSCNCTPYLAAAGSGTGAVPTGAEIPLGALVSHECARMKLVGAGIVSRGNARVDMDATVELTPASTAETPVELAVEAQANGQLIPGGRSSFKSTDTVAIPITCTVVGDCCAVTTITLVNAGVPATVGAVSIRAKAVK